jgi:hypothetical protein
MQQLGVPGFGPNDGTLAERLSRNLATTNPVNLTSYLGDGFFGAATELQNRTVIHELLHSIFYNGASLDGGHVGIAGALGLSIPSIEDLRRQYPEGTPDNVLEKLRDDVASEAINGYLDNNCGAPRN